MDVSAAQIGDWVWTWLYGGLEVGGSRHTLYGVVCSAGRRSFRVLWESDEISRVRRSEASTALAGFVNRRDMLEEARALFRARRLAVPALDRGELHVIKVTPMTTDAKTPLATVDEHHQKMERAFALVKHKGDWKAPIQAFVKAADLERLGLSIADVREAVVYFTATDANSLPRPDGYEVTAVGYRMGPAGP